MRKIIVFTSIFISTLLVQGWNFVCASSVDTNAEVLSKLQFQAPDNPEDRAYLGISEKRIFSLSDLKGKVVLIQIFSMYCPICQAEAPVINTAFRLLNDRPELAAKIRVLGIGAGNTPFEVDVYRRKYQVPFPLIPDDNMVFRKTSSAEIRTPTFFLVKVDEHGKCNIVSKHVGQMKDPQLYVDTIVKALDGK